MPPRLPDLEDLILLVLIAETGSIGRAAERRGLTQPSLSRRMTALERRMQVAILHRSHQGTTLTPAGRVVVDWASTLLDAAEEFTRSVETLRLQGEGAVHAGVSMTIAEHLAPRWLGLLRHRHPGVSVSLTVANSSDVADLVESGRAEIGFLESPHMRPGLARRRIGTDTLAVAVAPDHPWAGREVVVADAALAGTELLVREERSGTRETIENALARRGLTLLPGLQLASNTALKSAAMDGMGPVVLSGLAVAAELARGELVRVAVADLDLTRPFTAVWRRDHELSSSAAALLSIAVGARAASRR
jgi:DNA-binding transcriptional LysR family regulator